MIDFRKILREDRKRFDWIRPSDAFKMQSLDESTIANYLADYNNEFTYISSFIGLGNDPRMIEPSMISHISNDDLVEDSREYKIIPGFSLKYEEARRIPRTERLGKLIEEVDVRTDRLNRILPAIRDEKVNRYDIAKAVAKWASIPLLGYVGKIKHQEQDLFELVDLVYNYTPGKTAVTHSSFMLQLERELRRLS